jgi:hypothetical protein
MRIAALSLATFLGSPSLHGRATLLLAILAAGPGVAQTPAPAALDWWREDSARVAFVRAHGEARRYPEAVVWAPPDSLDPKWLESFADSLAQGIKALRALVGGPHPWQRIGARPVVFVLAPGRFVSHATGQDTVLIPLERVRRHSAPYLHEAGHELLSPAPPFFPHEYADSLEGEARAALFPFWLSEGLPDYLAQVVVERTGFAEGDIFEIGGLSKVDGTCRERLSAHPQRAAIVARIGGQGRLAALYTTERAQVAPTYYACSQSFTRFLADKVGLRTLVGLMPEIPSGRWLAQLETRAGAPLPALRREWLQKIGAPEAGGE